MEVNNKSKECQLSILLRKQLRIPQPCEIIITEKNVSEHEINSRHQCDGQKNRLLPATCVDIILPSKKNMTYTFDKKAADITADDIESLRQHLKDRAYKEYPLKARLFRLFGWWVIFTTSFSFFSICPICNQPGCAVGVASTGILAGIFAFLKMYLKDLLISIKRLFVRKGAAAESSSE